MQRSPQSQSINAADGVVEVVASGISTAWFQCRPGLTRLLRLAPRHRCIFGDGVEPIVLMAFTSESARSSTSIGSFVVGQHCVQSPFAWRWFLWNSLGDQQVELGRARRA